jgi:RNA polymerase sigma-70 factor (ECF subfamily)
MKNESHIISRMISGDINAFKLLFDRYYSQVRFFTLGIVKDSFVADDIAQNVFIKVWTKSSELSLFNLRKLLLMK